MTYREFSISDELEEEEIHIPGLTGVTMCGDFLVGKDEEGRLIAYRGQPYWAAMVDRIVKTSGLEAQLERMTFDSFRTDTRFRELMKKQAEAYVQDIAAGKKPWMFASGQPGSGKTHICTAVCGRLMERYGKAVR